METLTQFAEIVPGSLPDPNHFASIGWVLVIIVALITGLRQGISFVRELKDKPSPADVQRDAAALFCTKAEFAAHLEWNRREHESLFSKIGGVERGLGVRIDTRFSEMDKKAEDRHEKLHNRINGLLEVVSELRGKLEESSR